MSEEQAAMATHEELCDQALAHYERLSTELCDWLSTIPKAIEFYKQFGPGPMPETITLTREEVEEARQDSLIGDAVGQKGAECFLTYYAATICFNNIHDYALCRLCKRLTEFAQGKGGGNE